MEVAELKGTLLDHWVARSRGLKPYTINGSSDENLMLNDESAEFGCTTYQPSTDWATAGPIITRERISLQWINANWMAKKQFRDKSVVHCDASPLVAAMRCFVESRFGREVPNENENPPHITKTGLFGFRF